MLGRSRMSAFAASLAIMGAVGGMRELRMPPSMPRSLFNDPEPTSAGRRGNGATMAQQKRASKKARNVKRHKRHA